MQFNSDRNNDIFLRVLIVVLLSAIGVNAVMAQYFGRNKVKYDNFNFKVMKTEHFDIYFYPKESEAVTDAALMVERWYARLSKILQHRIKQTQPLILYANHADFQQTNVIRGLISQGTGGVTEGLQNRIVIPLTGVYRQNNHVLGHELVHAYQYDIARALRKGLRAMRRQPLWFVEGMAEYLSSGRHDAHTAMWMRDAVLNDDVPSIRQISRNQKYFPYRYGHALWAYITGRWGDNMVVPIFSQALKIGIDSTFRRILGLSTDSLSKDWGKALRETYSTQLEGKTKPQEVGERILAKSKDAGSMNLAPSISPSGRYVAFLSERDLFTIDLFLADAHTGKVLDKLASSATDAHFDALRFMSSSGSWSPDGKEFAFVVFSEGDNSIAIADVNSRDIKRNIKLDSVGAIYHLAWSPDGRYIAFSGSEGGISDIYLYDLSTDSVRELTDDRYADLQPAWSPDGNTLAFVTDRDGNSDFSELKFDQMRLALLNVESGKINLLDIFAEGDHINPRFSPEGRNIFFVSDPDGFKNVYRYNFRSGHTYRLTNVATGVSGVTALSPCMTVARNTGRLMFSVFEKTHYNVYALEPDETHGEQVYQVKDPFAITTLPPEETSEPMIVSNYLADYYTGLPQDRQFPVSDYSPSLKLKYIGQPTIGVGVDRFGSYLGGGASLLFGDILNNHMLGVAAQINGRIKDFGGQAIYRNQKERLNWGAALSHIPYRTERVFTGIDTVSVNGTPALARTINFVRQRTFNDRVSLLGEYPLSVNRRFEASLGFTRVSYDAEVEQITTVGGQIVDQTTEDLPAPDGLNLVHGSVGYVGDYSFFGFTSPIRGSRFRFEVEPTVGSLQFLTVLADYRKYFFWKPVTLAFRGMHYGRYAGDSESSRLTPLFLGYETFVRGYALGSFSASECSGTGDPSQCPAYDRMLGSRIAVFNAELRLPLFGTEQFGLINFPFLPTELSAFFDGGAAWTADESPTLEFKTNIDKRVPIFSTGLAARFNLFGALISQVYYAIPFQRPQKDGVFGFLFAVGW